MERDTLPFLRTPPVANFNSHAHVERDCELHFIIPFYIISTHTLTWSVTPAVSAFGNIQPISTHTLTWSVTKGMTYKEGDKFISTHTLTWSVTGRCESRQALSRISTHTLTWSVTMRLAQGAQDLRSFQLTRSRGA